ncbi:MAG: RtcB family protein [Planctomycetota bacterium]
MKRIDPNRLLIEKSGGMKVDALIFADEQLANEIESGAMDQLRDAAHLPGVFRAIGTPDMHFGYGVPIGVVVALEDHIVPAAVGYDINCGMRVITTPLNAADVNIDELAGSIARDIPLGEGKTNVGLPRHKFEVILNKGVKGLAEIAGGEAGRVWEARDPAREKEDIECIEEHGSMAGDCRAVSDFATNRGIRQLATLGGGNHFLELQIVEEVRNTEIATAFGLREKQLVVMLHSGSRGLGHQVCDEYSKRAKKISGDRAPSRDLCFLSVHDKAGQDYISAMNAAANFAFVNRQLMTELIRKNLRHHCGDIPLPIIYDVPHNMAKRETIEGRSLWVHRKGATRAFPPSKMQGTRFEKTGQPVLIPGSMGTPSYVLVGREESAESLYSVNHGAGRCMSRTAALGKVRKGKVLKPGRISDEDFKKSMEGIKLICADRHMIKEEAPQAYKDIDHVVRIVVDAGLAEVVAKLRPLAVLKG